MDTMINADKRIATLVVAALDGKLSEQQPEQLAAIDGELAKLAWLAAARRIAEQVKSSGLLHADETHLADER